MEQTRRLDPKHGDAVPRGLRLRVVEGIDQGMERVVMGDRVVIGRGSSVELELRDGSVSLFHCELTPLAEGVRVRDLGSRNGTFVGTFRIESGSLRYGETLGVGESKVIVDRADGAGAVETVDPVVFGGLVGDSQAMRRLRGALARLAPTSLSVLIEGDTGTGKELAARAIHDASDRASGPLVVLDCTAIPESLAESVLFGHERGAFTGASERRIGAFEAASGGTLFLDEIGELSPLLQPKLLRVLERLEIVPVGATRSRLVDVRVVSATLRDLRTAVNAGTFREDLYFRLAKVRVRTPSLEERRDDIPGLVTSRLASSRGAVRIDPEAMAELAQRAWPGNVRELFGVVDAAAALCQLGVIRPEDLTFERVLRSELRRDRSHEPLGNVEPFVEAKKTVIARFERDYLERLLDAAGTSVSRAAQLARVDRHTMRELLKRHGLRGEER